MKASIPDLESARGAGEGPERAERRAVYLRALSEASRELGSLSHPRKLAESFLLTILGTFGITKGWVGLFGTRTLEASFTASRGIPETETAPLGEKLPRIAARLLAERVKSSGKHSGLVVLTTASGSEAAWVGEDWELLIAWPMGEKLCGAAAIGKRITRVPLDREELDILEHFANVFVGALSRVLTLASIQQLNADLERKNITLQQALESADRARNELDRKIHQLSTLSDLTAELSSILQTDELLQTYILVSMGSIAIGSASLLLVDRESELVRTVVRGSAAEMPALTGPEAERLIYQCMGSSAKRSLTPMTVTRIDSSLLPAEAAVGLLPAVGLLFMVDQSLLGLACFGSRLSGLPISEDDASLLESLTSNFLPFLKNAKSFRTIAALNEDLAARNEDLTQTITELREARFKITLLEKAKTHLRSVVEREIARLGTARPIDFVLIGVLAAFLGLLFNYTNPQSLPLVPESWRRPPVQTMGSVEARQLVQGGKAILVDARPKELHDQQHIEGALNLPPSLFDLVYMMKVARLPADTTIIVYGRTVSRRYDEDVAHRLKRRDHEDVRVLVGAIEDWGREAPRSGP